MISSSKSVVLLIDTTYWGWRFGVVVFKDARTGKVLWRKFIRKKETLADYQEGIEWLQKHRFVIEGVVCDGLRGMFQMLGNYRVVPSGEDRPKVSNLSTGVAHFTGTA